MMMILVLIIVHDPFFSKTENTIMMTTFCAQRKSYQTLVTTISILRIDYESDAPARRGKKILLLLGFDCYPQTNQRIRSVMVFFIVFINIKRICEDYRIVLDVFGRQSFRPTLGVDRNCMSDSLH